MMGKNSWEDTETMTDSVPMGIMSAPSPLVPVNIKIVRDSAVVPQYATSGSSGFDFVALKTIHVHPMETVLFETGLIFEIPPGLEIQIRPRSGLSKKTPLRVANSPGTIDSDYRGEVGILLHNIGDWPVLVSESDKIAQGVLCPVYKAKFIINEQLSATQRGSGGFGSTG
jgi:dUTP pyrophosphatase